MLQDGELGSALARPGRERALNYFLLKPVVRKYERVLENTRQEQVR